MAIYDLDTLTGLGFTTWDEVFQSENGQQVGWARQKVTLSGAAGTYQIGTLVVLGDDLKSATVPADFAALAAAGEGKIAILGGKDLKGDASTGFNRNIVILNAQNVQETKAVVVFDGRAGGAIGDAEIKFPTGTTTANKATIFARLKAENGFKVLKQQVKG